MKMGYIMKGTIFLATILSSVFVGQGEENCAENVTINTDAQGNVILNCKAQNLADFPSLGRVRSQVKCLYLQFNSIEIIRSNSFQNFSSLTELNMRGNKISRIEKGAFSCLKRLRKMDLSSNMLSRFPLAAMGPAEETLIWLSLAMNSLREIPIGLTQFQQLKHLDLSNNRHIISITIGSLPSSLTELDLRFTGIKYFPPMVFSHLGGLKVLLLSDNSASSSLKFSKTAFTGLRSLEHLDLSRSFCRNLPADSFSTLSNLTTLLMNNCWLPSPPKLYGSVTEGQVAGTLSNDTSMNQTLSNQFIKGWYNPRLQILDLSNNRRMLITPKNLVLPSSLTDIRLNRCKIPTVDVSMFSNASSAHNIDLCFSGLSTIPKNAFRKSHRLLHICLSGNPITSVPKLPESLLYLNMSKIMITKISRRPFASLHKLKEVDMNHGRINHIQDFSFSAMISLTKLDLSHNAIRSVTKNTFYIGATRERRSRNSKPQSHLLELNLSSNSLESLARKAFATHKQLQKLDLKDNMIHMLQRKVFEGLEKLMVLNMKGNRLFDIEPGVFSDLKNMQVLHLEQNELEYLVKETFSGLTNLKELHLQNNKVLLMDRLPLPMLVYLDISNNNLTKLPKMNSRIIRTIRASHNLIADIPSLAFRYGDKLETLDLSHCFISSVNYSVFSSTPSLKTLDLTSNFITKFVDEKIPMLENLLVGANHIGSMPHNLRNILPKIQILNLRLNNIRYLNPKIFEGLSHLQKLYLTGNNFFCDCKLVDLVEWMVKRSDIVNDPNLYLCEGPLEEYAMPVMDVVSELSSCTPTPNHEDETVLIKQTHIVVIITAGGAMVLLSAIFFACIFKRRSFIKRKLRVNDNNNKHILHKFTNIKQDEKDNSCQKLARKCFKRNFHQDQNDSKNHDELERVNMMQQNDTPRPDNEASGIL